MPGEARTLTRRGIPLLVLGVLLAGACAQARAAGLNLRQPPSGVSVISPGLPSAAPSASALSAALHASTGLAPSELTSAQACPPVGSGTARCDAEVIVLRSDHRPVHAHPQRRPSFTQVFPRHQSAIASVTPAGATGSAPPAPATPAWLQQAYDLTYLSQTGGVGDTVAIVDAYDDPNAAADLAFFRSQYGLPPCTTASGCFAKVNENGQTSPLPAGDVVWEGEESLDMDAVSSVCPNCRIVLVEANSSSFSDLESAEQTAASTGARQISNSWSGDSTSPTMAALQFSFPGVAVIASTGDCGYIPQCTSTVGADAYPAGLPNVTAAGGTTVAAASGGSSARGFSESAWSLNSNGWGGSSGCDLQEHKPSYQTDVGCTGRSYADLSADADPNTGLLIYDSGNGGWEQYGGTSLSSPLIAAYEAVTGVSGFSPGWAYSDSAVLNDPSTGSVGTCPAKILYICNAGVGYDGPTGVGSISGDVVAGAPGIGGPGVGNGSANTYTASVSAIGATLTAGIYPNGLDTTYYWQYGTTTGYGQQTRNTDIGSGQTPVWLTTTVTGLAPSTTYHYRLVAVNNDGTTYGYDYQLTTLTAGDVPPLDSTLPAITGTPIQGQALSASTGSWSSSPTAYAYQWQRSADGGATWSNINGATAGTYTVAGADLGDDLQVIVTASNSYGSTSATAASVGPVASAAPYNTGAPQISGSAIQGNVLTVSSTWNPPGTDTYQWQRSAGTTWASISGATASSYTPAAADQGDTIRVTVTATNAYGQASATSPAVGPVVSDPPVNSSPPVVTGTPQRTFTLSATSGAWSGNQNTYSYQWQRAPVGGSWTSISAANSSTYTLAIADEGDELRVLVTASNVLGLASLASTATQMIAPDPPANTSAPTVTGIAERTYALTVARGAWTGPDNVYSCQWQEDSGEGYAAIPGATNYTYMLTAADEGSTVRAVVTATNPDATIAEASQPTTTVLAALPVNTTAPAISGTAQRATTLTASEGVWQGLGNTYAYQWQDSIGGNTWASIPGATGATYTLGVGDEGTQVQVMLTATNADGSATATSSPTAVVPASPPVATAAPTISGTAQRTDTLTSTQGTWTGIGNAYAYQWQRSSGGGSPTNISGATASSYTLAAADEGDNVRLQVTATNRDATVSVASAATSTVQGAPPVDTAPPVVTGSAVRTGTLNATQGTWGGLGNVYAYRWQRSSGAGSNWTNISAATLSSYTVAVADEGSQLRIQVTATNPDAAVSAVSAATATVPSAPPVNTIVPAVAGTPERGATLTSAQGTWSGTGNSYAYQWQSSADGGHTWTTITGATSSSYAPAVSDEGTLVRIAVTATNPDGTVSAHSAATAAITADAPVETVLPAVTGTLARGSTLSAANGSWTGLGNTYDCQWQRSDDGGATWTSIGGQSATYTTAVADEGNELHVLITVTNPDGTAGAASAPTAVIPSAPPLDTTLPVIAGTVARGSSLSATPGTWTGIGNAYSYQWQRNSGSGFTDISGATSATYLLEVADEGSTMRMLVTTTNPDGTVQATSLASATVPSAPPVATAVPVVTGTAQRSSLLTATQGSWSGIGNSYAYQWQRSPDGLNWTDIDGATSLTYTAVVADEHDAVRFEVTATNPDATATAISAATATVQTAPPVKTAPPAIAGAAQRSSTLTSTQGTWSGAGNTYALQWQRSTNGGTTWAKIVGATAATYTLAVADEGAIVELAVTATNPDGTAVAASAPSATVVGAAPADTVAPAITGTARRAVTLTATQGTWTGVGNTYSYQWRRSLDDGSDWTAITGATGSSYTPAVADEGAIVELAVTATNPDGTVTATSAATSAVLADPPVNTGAPTITGTPTRTDVLTATPGAWSGAGDTYALQWQRSANQGASWAPIAGATGSAYTLAAADEGDNVSVVVTATDPDGGAVADSAATPQVQGAPPVNAGLPTITGAAGFGATLSASTGGWTPDTTGFTYAWQRSSAGGGYQAIAGAASATYQLADADVGQTVRVLVTAANIDGSATATSAATATVLNPPQSTVAPTAPSGTLMDSYTLTAVSGTWNQASLTYAYGWERCPASDTATSANCTEIGTGSAYKLTAADIGSLIGVTVTATSAGGQTTVDSPLTAAVTGRPLTNLVAPSIGGNPQVPQTLTANLGTWSVPVTGVTYIWDRCDGDGVSDCASVGTGGSYTLSGADGEHTIVLVADVSSPGQTASAQSPALSVTDQPLPQNTLIPAISGTPQRGGLLTAAPGQWTNDPTVFSYQWEDCDATGHNCQAIAAATTGTHTLVRSDEGGDVTVVVTAGNSDGSAAATAAAVGPIAAVLPVSTTPPTIQTSSSVMQQGVTLTLTGQVWQGTPDTTYSYAWERCDAGGANCQAISGATATQYTLTAADVGSTVIAISTATNADGPVSADSRHTVVVLPAAPRWKALPILSTDPGDVGDLLSITAGVWTGPAVRTDTVELMRCTNLCVTDGSANPSSYRIAEADIGSILRIEETAGNAGGATVVWSSRYVGPVMSAASATAILSAGRATLRNLHGTVLATAQVSSAPVGVTADLARAGLGRTAVAARPRARAIALHRAPGLRGKLVAWACPATTAAGGPPGACSARVSIGATATLRLPASLTGHVRIVVVRKGATA